MRSNRNTGLNAFDSSRRFAPLSEAKKAKTRKMREEDEMDPKTSDAELEEEDENEDGWEDGKEPFPGAAPAFKKESRKRKMREQDEEPEASDDEDELEEEDDEEEMADVKEAKKKRRVREQDDEEGEMSGEASCGCCDECPECGCADCEYSVDMDGDGEEEEILSEALDPRKAIVYFDLCFEEDNYLEAKDEGDDHAAELLALGKGNEEKAIHKAEDLAMEEIEKILKKSGVRVRLDNEGHDSNGDLVMKFGVDSLDDVKKILKVINKASGGGDDDIYLDYYFTARGFLLFPQGVNGLRYNVVADEDDWTDALSEADEEENDEDEKEAMAESRRRSRVLSRTLREAEDVEVNPDLAHPMGLDGEDEMADLQLSDAEDEEDVEVRPDVASPKGLGERRRSARRASLGLAEHGYGYTVDMNTVQVGHALGVDGTEIVGKVTAVDLQRQMVQLDNGQMYSPSQLHYSYGPVGSPDMSVQERRLVRRVMESKKPIRDIVLGLLSESIVGMAGAHQNKGKLMSDSEYRKRYGHSRMHKRVVDSFRRKKK